jgi:hypothetical protein
LAVLIEVADEGQVELAMANAFKRDLGKKQISVKTYSSVSNLSALSLSYWITQR